MLGLHLRPLTLGEILDRTFVLYRQHFLLFVGITAVPQLLVLAINLTRTLSFNRPAAPSLWQTALVSLIVLVITYIAAMFAQAATIFAVTDFYLGKLTSIGDALRRAWGEIGTVIGVSILSSIIVLVGLLFLIFPGIYLACRYFAAVPAALVERQNANDALGRSWRLTQSNAGRAFLIILLYVAISFAASMLINVPLGVAIVMNKANPGALHGWTALAQVANTIANILVTPILLIATSLFYFDLRVRKEAFDLQYMMDPDSERLIPPGAGPIPSILS